DSAVAQLEGLVTEARAPLSETFENVSKFTKALGDNAENIDSFLASVGELSQSVSQVSDRLDSTLAAAESLINAVDREKVSSVIDDVSTFTAQLSAAGERLDSITTGVDNAVASIGRFSTDANATLGKIDDAVSSFNPELVGVVVQNFADASGKVDRACEQIARISETIGDREEDINQFISDAKEMAGRLNQASTRVDGVLAKLDGLLGSDDTGDLMADARATLSSFRQVADTLNARIGTITGGLAR